MGEVCGSLSGAPCSAARRTAGLPVYAKHVWRKPLKGVKGVGWLGRGVWAGRLSPLEVFYFIWPDSLPTPLPPLII